MRTYYIKDTKKGMVGKVEIDGSVINVTTIRTVLKPWVKVVLAFLAGLLVGALVYLVASSVASSEAWYQECDQALGYTTDYYTCRLYHIRNK